MDIKLPPVDRIPPNRQLPTQVSVLSDESYVSDWSMTLPLELEVSSSDSEQTETPRDYQYI